MTAKESIIEDLGNIVFRIETNSAFLAKHKYDADKTKYNAAEFDIKKDIEKLKTLKTMIENSEATFRLNP